MKTKTKSKPSTPKPDNQLTLDILVTAINTLQVKVSRIDSWVDKLSEKLYVRADAEVTQQLAKPTLKWFEQEPQTIEWHVCCDPDRLVLAPGTTLRYNIDDEIITNYDGVTIGELNSLGHNIICEGVRMGAKVHVYLTTSRKLGIKLGR